MGANEPEIRIGLVLYGGVSLAVYIYGVVIEVQRLLRTAIEPPPPPGEPDRRPAYARALGASAAAKVTVDIVSGTSAGGINGILLAKALARGGDVEQARDVWLDGGDIEQLLQPPSLSDPKALLQSEYFERQLEKGLARLDVKGAPGTPSPPPILDLFVSSTHLRGGQRRFGDSLDTEIATRQHRYVFQLKLRRRRWTEPGPRGYNHDDFRDNARLTKLARATSAFPGAFEPVLIDQDDQLLEAGDQASGWFADGGILNNKPFSEAIETIFKRSSRRPVRRWLFSIDPDPVTAVDEEVPGPEPAFDQIAIRSIAAIPRYQSIARDLADLEAHNERVAAAERVVLELEAEIAAATPDGMDGDAALPPLGLGPAAAYAALRRQAWELEIADRLMSTLRAGDGVEVDRAAAHRAFRQDAATAIDASDGDAEADLAFHLRRIYYTVKLLSMAREVESGDPAAARDALWAEFERLSEALTSTLVDPEGIPEALRQLGQAGEESIGRLRGALEGVRVLLPDSRSDQASTLVSLAQVFDDFPRRDAMLLSADVYGGLRRRDRIRHAQISPVAARNTGIDGERKLAGDSLGHFGGFLDRDWRSNDLMWGRLDGAEVLMRAILADHDGDEEAALVDATQEEILEDELPEVLGGPEPWKQKLKAHVGDGPSPAGLDGRRMFGMGLRTAAIVRKMLLTAAKAAAEGGGLSGVRAFALRAVANGIGFLLALIYLPARALFAKGKPVRRAIVVLALLPFLWGVATFVLGILGVLPFTKVVGPAAIGIAVYPLFLLVYWGLAVAGSKLSGLVKS